MPTFLDRHALTAVPRAVQHQLRREALQGLVDPHGAQPLGHWFTDGVLYCVMQAPSPEAFCQHHAEHGLACDDQHPIMGLRASHPLSAAELQHVHTMIAELWPTDRHAT